MHMRLTEGTRVLDKAADDAEELVVIRLLDDPAGEVPVTYDFNMNPITVADYNADNLDAYDDPADTVVEAAFVEDLNRRFDGWQHRSDDYLKTLVEEEKLKPYKYPVSRLQAASEQR